MTVSPSSVALHLLEKALGVFTTSELHAVSAAPLRSHTRSSCRDPFWRGGAGSAAHLVDRTVAHLGRLDVLVRRGEARSRRFDALELAPFNIRVVAVQPAFIRTPLISAEIEQAVLPLHPVGRLGEADEVASLVSFVGSDEASFITGAAYLSSRNGS